MSVWVFRGSIGLGLVLGGVGLAYLVESDSVNGWINVGLGVGWLVVALVKGRRRTV